MWGTWVRSLGWEDPLEKEMATRSSTLAWKIPWTEEPGRLQSMGWQRVGRHNWVASLSLFLISAATTMLKLKLQCFGHLMWTADSLEKTLKLGKIESKRRRGRQRMNFLDSVTDSMHVNLSKHLEIVKDRGAWHATVHVVGHDLAKSWTWLNN